MEIETNDVLGNPSFERFGWLLSREANGTGRLRVRWSTSRVFERRNILTMGQGTATLLLASCEVLR
jgi:hypothetical protein